MLWLESSSFCKVCRESLAYDSVALALARSSNALPAGKNSLQYHTLAAKDPTGCVLTGVLLPWDPHPHTEGDAEGSNVPGLYWPLSHRQLSPYPIFSDSLGRDPHQGRTERTPETPLAALTAHTS